MAEEERQKAAKEAREKCEADGTGVMSESEHQAAARRAALASRVLQLWTKGSDKAGKKAKEKKRKEEESATSVTWNLDDPNVRQLAGCRTAAYMGQCSDLFICYVLHRLMTRAMRMPTPTWSPRAR